jgi:uncharacterized protein (TIGR03435 family)
MGVLVVRRLNLGRGPLLLMARLIVAVPLSMLAQGSATSTGGTVPTATTDVKVPTFDVVSIKPNKSASGMVKTMFKPDGYAATNVSLNMLIQAAYGVKEDQISGAPSWADSARYDIDAKVAGPDVPDLQKMKNEDRGVLLQPLLAERFKLAIHHETKVLPIYELVVAKNGPKLKEATPGDTGGDGIKGPYGVPRAGMMMMRPGQLTGQGIPMTSLANQLSRPLHRTVIDKTGLTGKYDLTLQWTDDHSDLLFKGPDGSPQRADPVPDASGPSLFTALQEQLGLKLQSTKGPVETIVIDHVEMPSEN